MQNHLQGYPCTNCQDWSFWYDNLQHGFRHGLTGFSFSGIRIGEGERGNTKAKGFTAMASTSIPAKQRKQQIRSQAHERRREQEDKDVISEQIVGRFIGLPEYQDAATVMFYVDVRAEVRTRFALPDAIASGKRIIVPYCVDGILELFLLEEMEELEVGMYSILEPRLELREIPQKRIAPSEIDLVMVPGVAFDARGGRTGHGNGYYDKLLELVRPDTPLVALAFDCQIFPEVPMGTHDVFMDKIVTESEIHIGRGRTSEP
jgi:5-formyltetrahydrofolate cyclo-ligase